MNHNRFHWVAEENAISSRPTGRIEMIIPASKFSRQSKGPAGRIAPEKTTFPQAGFLTSTVGGAYSTKKNAIFLSIGSWERHSQLSIPSAGR
jgi:hypothetical protein